VWHGASGYDRRDEQAKGRGRVDYALSDTEPAPIYRDAERGARGGAEAGPRGARRRTAGHGQNRCGPPHGGDGAHDTHPIDRDGQPARRRSGALAGVHRKAEPRERERQRRPIGRKAQRAARGADTASARSRGPATRGGRTASTASTSARYIPSGPARKTEEAEGAETDRRRAGRRRDASGSGFWSGSERRGPPHIRANPSRPRAGG
jgi:hypothetical protein